MPESSTAHQPRKMYWIEKYFQNRIISRFALTALGSIVLANLMTLGYLKIREWVKPSEESLIYLANSMTESVAVGKLIQLLWPPLLLATLLAVIFAGFLSLFFSHRIAGPLFNLKRMFRLVEAGNFTQSMRIRKTDELKDIEEAFNQMLRSLNTRMAAVAAILPELPAAARKKIEKALGDIQINH